MQERRKHERFNVSIKVNYRLMNWNESYASLSKNLSEGGICLLLDVRLKAGTLIELEFQKTNAKSQKPFVAKGTVVWSKDAGLYDEQSLNILTGSVQTPWKIAVAPPQGKGTDSFQRYYETGIQLSKESARLVTKLLGSLV